MDRRTRHTGFRKELTTEEIAAHLHQLCLLRRHLSTLVAGLYPLSAESEHLSALRAEIDRHQARYTGNEYHFYAGHIALLDAAND